MDEFTKLMEQAVMMAKSAAMVRRVLPHMNETDTSIIARMIHESFEQSYQAGYIEGANHGARSALMTVKHGFKDGVLDVEKLAECNINLDEIDPTEANIRVTLYAERTADPSEPLPNFDDVPLTDEDLATFEQLSDDLSAAGLAPVGMDERGFFVLENGVRRDLSQNEIATRINNLFQ
jgi:hypothetical protein